MAVLKSADFRSRNIFTPNNSMQKMQEVLKAEYLKQALIWQRWSRQTSALAQSEADLNAV